MDFLILFSLIIFKLMKKVNIYCNGLILFISDYFYSELSEGCLIKTNDQLHCSSSSSEEFFSYVLRYK